jgi:hypothetical protein
MTLTLDDHLYDLARRAAASEGKTLEQYLGDLVRRAVRAQDSPRVQAESGLPVMVVPEGTPLIDPRRVKQAVEEGEF